MNRRLLVVALVGVIAVGSLITWKVNWSPAQPPAGRMNGHEARPPAPPLPVAQVILFNSGVA
ncbi:MAG: hypothetical protein JO112_20810, partial [Planctomycetes bacterium]|nr:hypothetical protein [Planctomycetota bacterium]